MIDLETSSSTTTWPVVAGRVPLRRARSGRCAGHAPIVARGAGVRQRTHGPIRKGIRCRNVSYPLIPLLLGLCSDKIH